MSNYEDTIARAAIPEILDTADLGLVLKRSPRAARRLVASGIIPGILLAGRWLVRRDDLLEALSPSAGGREWPPDGVDGQGQPWFRGGAE